MHVQYGTVLTGPFIRPFLYSSHFDEFWQQPMGLFRIEPQRSDAMLQCRSNIIGVVVNQQGGRLGDFQAESVLQLFHRTGHVRLLAGSGPLALVAPRSVVAAYGDATAGRLSVIGIRRCCCCCVVVISNVGLGRQHDGIQHGPNQMDLMGKGDYRHFNASSLRGWYQLYEDRSDVFEEFVDTAFPSASRMATENGLVKVQRQKVDFDLLEALNGQRNGTL